MRSLRSGLEASERRTRPALNVRGGTQGVGRATTQAVVVASVMIIGADLFLTKLALYLGDKIF